MHMKVFNKGQVVIPAIMRNRLGIHIGDLLDVTIDETHKQISLSPRHSSTTASLAGSLSKYGRAKKFPSRQEMAHALKKGLLRD